MALRGWLDADAFFSTLLESLAISGDLILAVARWNDGDAPPGVDRVYNLLTMRDGRIVRMEDFFDRDAAERALLPPDEAVVR